MPAAVAGRSALLLASVLLMTADGSAQSRAPQVASACSRAISRYYDLGAQEKDALSAADLQKHHDTIEGCVFDHWEELTREQLAHGAYCLEDIVSRKPDAPTTRVNEEASTPPEPPKEKPLHSGRIMIYPLDIGEKFEFAVGDEQKECRASSTKEITCQSNEEFQAVLADQEGREYLIACKFDNYETCADLPTGAYAVVVHGRSLTVLNSGLSMINRETGKRISSITPVLSVLTRLR